MDRAALTEAFQRVEASREADKPERSTSAAKELDARDLEGTTLENAPALGAQFDAARADLHAEQLAGDGSQQVRDAGASHDMRPSPEIARPADREKHQADMARDDAASQTPDVSAMAAALAERQAEAARSIDQERSL